MPQQERDDDQRGHGPAVLDREPITKSRDDVNAQKPSLYHVILLNDDYTPFEFVVQALQEVFAMDEAKAVRVMLQVHNSGKGTCGTFVKDVAEAKAAQVVELARTSGHPLQATVEEE